MQGIEDQRPEEVAELVGSALSGERAAFAELCVRFERPIFLLAYRLVGNEADAMDVVQNTLLRTYKGLSTYDGDRPFHTWLLAIAVNEARRLLRRRCSRKAVSLTETGDEPPVDTRKNGLEGVTRAELTDALDRVPSDERTAFVLRYVESHTPGEVAELMGVSERTVRRLCQKARARLRRLLGDDDGD
jgi:RNA polymerase sigma-70 factor (ECF subfamily)